MIGLFCGRKFCQGLYYKFGHDVKGYTTLMEEGMNETIQALDRELSVMDIEELKNTK